MKDILPLLDGKVMSFSPPPRHVEFCRYFPLSQSWGQVLSGMCEMDHNDNRDGYGENLYMCWGSASGCYDAGGALKSWCE